MNEPDSMVTQKRKASPSEVEDDVQAKRTKTDTDDQVGDDNALGGLNPAVSPRELPDPSPGPKSEIHGLKIEIGHEKHDTVPSKADDANAQNTSPEARRPSTSGQTRKSSSLEEEKRRGKRLFGGLLSTLSQTASTTKQQKRRQEVEKKQQDRVKHQRAEEDKRRAERLDKLERLRRIEQVKFDQQVMKTRHSNLLAMARSLRTKARPQIHYVPWELTKEQEDSIKEQVREAEELIEREAHEFEQTKERRLEELGDPSARSPSRSIPVGDPPPPQEANKVPSSKMTHEKDNDERDDEMVQDREDDVLY